MATLYEYLEMTKRDYDTYDTKYDAEVTVCYIDEECDEYDKFCNGIIKMVNVVNVNDDNVLVIDWSNLIETNIDKFREFANKYWREDCQYKDDYDEFVYQWINEIHYYMAGCVDEDFYSILNNLLSDIEPKVWVCVYHDTIEAHDDDWNITDILVTKEFAERYFNECIKTKEWNEWETFEEFYSEYIADDTEDFYEYATEHNAIIKMNHWK